MHSLLWGLASSPCFCVPRRKLRALANSSARSRGNHRPLPPAPAPDPIDVSECQKRCQQVPPAGCIKEALPGDTALQHHGELPPARLVRSRGRAFVGSERAGGERAPVARLGPLFHHGEHIPREGAGRFRGRETVPLGNV